MEIRKIEEQVTSSSISNYMTGAFSFIIMVSCAFAVIYRQNPPNAQPADAPVAEFASGRAMNHLKMIARSPHPIGSAEHSNVRDYILKEMSALGLGPEVQKSLAVNQENEGSYVAAGVQNIIGKIEGAGSRYAVLLACHYDTVPNSPGANDDGAGVTTLLEVMRAIKAGPPLKNDLVFLFTDGEEIGMLGAKAFMHEHSYAKDIAVVLNFEARGANGPSIMFETSEGNEWLINEFSRTIRHPVTNSLTYDLYKLLPNATDMTIFKSGGLRGLNFAYIAGLSTYHTARDSYVNIDERSLQHHGSYALALARRFGNVVDWPAPTGDAVYFDLFSSVLISYPKRLVLPLMALGLAFYIVLVTLGLRMKRLTIRGIAFSVLSLLLNAISVGILIMLMWLAIRSRNPNPFGGNYNSDFFVIGFLSLTIALTGALLGWFRKKTRIENLMVGALLWWCVLMVLVCLKAPGGSYLITWPLLLMILALGAVFISREEMTSMKTAAILVLPGLSIVILIAPLLRLLIAGFGMEVVWMLMILVVFLLAMYYAHLNLLLTPRLWPFTLISGLFGLCFVCAGILSTEISKKHPKWDHILYALNIDKKRAIWGSADENPDEWTSQFFSSGAEKADMGEHFPWAGGGGTILKGDAPVLPLAPPAVAVLDDRTADGLRSLRLRLTSPRRAPAMSIYWKRELELAVTAVNGSRVVKENLNTTGAYSEYRRFSYFGMSEGVELNLEIKSSAPLELYVEDWSYGLPEIPGRIYKDRPDHIVPSPFHYSDGTVVMRSARL